MMVDSAIQYASYGYRVFPLHTVMVEGDCTCGRRECTAVGKHPRTEHGVKDATTDQEQVRRWWRSFPRSNIRLAMGNGLMVIDIDPRHGGSLETLKKIAPLPKTASVYTGGGGWHLYFTYDPILSIRNSAGLLGQGIDVRGDGGYVVAPPSLHASGRCYTLPDDTRPVRLPEAFLHRLLALKGKQEKATPPVKQPSTAAQPAQDLVISEGQRNDRLFSLACKLRNWGASDQVVEIALNAANNMHCQPPMGASEVQQIVGSSQRYESGAPLSPLRILGYAEAMSMTFPEPKWAVERFLPEGVTLLGGKPKMGKSWLALWISLAIASGRLPTTQGSVLYLALEDGARRVVERTKKLLQGQPWPESFVGSNACEPLAQGGLGGIEEWLKEASDPRLVVIDTLVRVRANGSGGSIYAEEYAGIVPIKDLAERYHVAILVVHHLRKASATDAMDEFSGSTGLTGATDCNMVLRRERGKGEGTLHITGRDVEEQTLSLMFDKETARWSLTDSPDDDESERVPAISKERQELLDLLGQKDHPISPSEIAQELGREQNTIRNMLFKLARTGEVRHVGRGLYEVPRSSTTSSQHANIANIANIANDAG